MPSFQLLDPKNGWRRLHATFTRDDYWITLTVWVGTDGTIRIPQIVVSVVPEHFGPTRGDAASTKDIDVSSAALRAPIGDYRLEVLEAIRRDPGLLSPAAFEAQLAAAMLERDPADFPQDDGNRYTVPDGLKDLFLRVVEQGDKDLGKVTELASMLRKGPKQGRGAHSPDFYRETARLYLRLYPEHRQRVVKAMAETTGKPRDTVATWVRRAREEGWLEKGTQGKAGGGPGPRLREWLERQEANR